MAVYDTDPRTEARQQRTANRARRQPPRVVNKTGGGFNPSVNPSLNITLSKGGGGSQAGAAAPKGGGSGTPGSDFMSNEDIHKFAEYLRKTARHRAVERAMDAAQLEAVLRSIPDSTGSMAGARMRARRVSRNLKRIARAEQLIAKWAAGLYAAFEKEYESELRKIGKGRAQQNVRNPFGWK